MKPQNVFAKFVDGKSRESTKQQTNISRFSGIGTILWPLRGSRRGCEIILLCLLIVLAATSSPAQLIGPNPNDQPKFDADTWRNAMPGIDYVENELLLVFEPHLFSVQFDDPNDLNEDQIGQLHREVQALAETIANENRLVVLDTSPILHSALLQLRDRPNRNQPARAGERLFRVLKRLDRRDDRIRFLEPNGLQYISETNPPTDPVFPSQSWHYGVIGAMRGWDTIPTDFQVRVAVLDTGFRYDHPDASPGMLPTQDFDFITSRAFVDCTGSILANDMDIVAGPDDNATDSFQLTQNAGTGCFVGDTLSHGTHVAGTIASAWDNGQGGVGVIGRIEQGLSSLFNLIPVRVMDVLGRGTFWDISQGIIYAAGLPASNGSGGVVQIPKVHIMNMSFGGGTLSIVQFLAVVRAFNQDVLIVAAAGNGGNTPNPSAPQFPAVFGQVVAVSNMTLDGASQFILNPSSSFYPGVELTAPGTTVASLSYNYTACTVGVPCLGLTGGLPTTVLANGTSMASPHVAGVAALYKAHNPGFTMTQLRQTLQDNAIDIGLPGIDDSFGAGLVQVAPGPGVKLVTNRSQPFVLLLDEPTGAVQDIVQTDMSGNYSFSAVPAGDYILLGAHDEDGDGVFGETGEGVGAIGGTLQNAPVFTQIGLGPISGVVPSGSLGWPDQETELLNDTMAGAGDMFVGFYAESTYTGTGDEDWFKIKVPQDGLYIIWTEGRNTTLCQENFLEYDSVIELYEVGGSLLAQNNDAPPNPAIVVPPPALGLNNRCSQISIALNAGTYFVRLYAQNVATALSGARVILHFDSL